MSKMKMKMVKLKCEFEILKFAPLAEFAEEAPGKRARRAKVGGL